MKCPFHHANLKTINYHGVDVDICPSCQGIWFDKGELKEYLDNFLTEKKDIPVSDFQVGNAVNKISLPPQTSLDCPRCGKSLVSFNYAYNSNILLEKCLNCNGIWVDGGKLTKLANYMKGNPKMDKLGKDLVALDADWAEYNERMGDVKSLNNMAYDMNYRPWRVMWGPRLVLPLTDNVPCTKIPFMVFLIILVNIGVYLYQTFYLSDPGTLFNEYGFIPYAVLTYGEYYRFITALFLHNGFFHLVGEYVLLLAVWG